MAAAEGTIEEKTSLKRKLDDEELTASESKRRKLSELVDLSDFKVDEILNLKEGHFVHLKCVYNGTQPAIIKIRNSMPKGTMVVDKLADITTKMKGGNITWAAFEGFLQAPNLGIDVFCPGADEKNSPEKIKKLMMKQVRKLQKKEMILVREPPEFYRSVTLPYIRSIPESDVEWVHNIVNNVDSKPRCVYDIEKPGINEKVVYSDPDPELGFALLVDFKWKRHPKTMAEIEEKQLSFRNATDVYCIAFPMDKSIVTLRDLRAKHIPLLLNIKKYSLQYMKQIYGVPEHRVKMFVHYLPQFYYLHIHVTCLEIDYNVECTRSHLLEVIISNLTMCPNYYANVSLTYRVPENHPCAIACLEAQDESDIDHEDEKKEVGSRSEPNEKTE